MARKSVEYVKTISRVERMGTSYYGNPYYRIHFDDGTSARTQINASISYGLENRENIGVPVLVKATPAGRVWDVKPV